MEHKEFNTQLDEARIESAIAAHFFRAPTILAWDLVAVCRILPIEARSP